MFIQPDWFEVTKVGVGTNRYSYSFNDPVNLRDPQGNLVDTVLEEQRLRMLQAQAGANSQNGGSPVGGGGWAFGALRTIGLTVTLALTPSPLAVGTPQLGTVLTEEQLSQGWRSDGQGNILDGEGTVVRDRSGGFRRENSAKLRSKVLGGNHAGNPARVHHIVEVGSKSALAGQLALTENGIGLNSLENLVALKNHTGRHSKAYSKAVAGRLFSGVTRALTLEILAEIKSELETIDAETEARKLDDPNYKRDTIKEWTTRQ